MPTKRYFSIAMDWRKLVLTKMTHWLLLGKTHGWWLSFVLYPTYLTNIIMKAWNDTVNCCNCSWNLWFVVIASRCARYEYGMLVKIAYEYFSMSELHLDFHSKRLTCPRCLPMLAGEYTNNHVRPDAFGVYQLSRNSNFIACVPRWTFSLAQGSIWYISCAADKGLYTRSYWFAIRYFIWNFNELLKYFRTTDKFIWISLVSKATNEV